MALRISTLTVELSFANILEKILVMIALKKVPSDIPMALIKATQQSTQIQEML